MTTTWRNWLLCKKKNSVIVIYKCFDWLPVEGPQRLHVCLLEDKQGNRNHCQAEAFCSTNTLLIYCSFFQTFISYWLTSWAQAAHLNILNKLLILMQIWTLWLIYVPNSRAHTIPLDLFFRFVVWNLNMLLLL